MEIEFPLECVVEGVAVSLLAKRRESIDQWKSRIVEASRTVLPEGHFATEAPIAVTRRLQAMGIRDKPIAPGSPWQNGCAERLIGSICRECADDVVALSARHLRRILQFYALYYNEARTHRSLNKDAPFHRATERIGAIISRPILVDFTTDIAESSFRYTHPPTEFESRTAAAWPRPAVS